MNACRKWRFYVRLLQFIFLLFISLASSAFCFYFLLLFLLLPATTIVKYLKCKRNFFFFFVTFLCSVFLIYTYVSAKVNSYTVIFFLTPQYFLFFLCSNLSCCTTTPFALPLSLALS